MRLTTIQVKNYRCFVDSEVIPVHDMTVLIGGNDCGKSSILRALCLFFKTEKFSFSLEDFRKVNNVYEKSMEIELVFALEGDDNPKDYRECVIDNKITAKRLYQNTEGGITEQFLVKQNEFVDKRLNELKDLKAGPLEELCGAFNKPYTNKEDAIKVLTACVQEQYDTIPKSPNYSEGNWQKLRLILPSFELYDSSNYKDAQGLIQKTLSDVYRTFFYQVEDGKETPLAFLTGKEDEIKNSLNEKLEKDLLEKIKEMNEKVKSVKGKFQIDFATGFTLQTLLVDFGQGQGENPLSNVGEGTKKRLFLVINEWDREIRSKTGPKKRVIRGYDEPDASLHYGAQKSMFYSLRRRSQDPNDKLQVLICTHSLAMVDRAPAGTINHLIEKDGASSVNYLKSGEDSEVKEFLDSISEISGIKNSSLFFERCFLIVEGLSEEYFLPLAYQKAFNRSLAEDGVVLINLKNNCSWQAFLKLLSKNKAEATILMLDNDSQRNANSKVTPQKLTNIGFSASFLTNNVFLIGTNEFEDIFSNEIICRCLNQFWAKVEGEQWNPVEIQELRREGKFSEKLVNLVDDYRVSHNVSYQNFGKPEFGKRLGEQVSVGEFNGIPQLQALERRISEIIR